MIVDQVYHGLLVFFLFSCKCLRVVFVIVLGLYVKSISCSVQMNRILTFITGGSSCFYRIVATIDEDRKMAL